MNTTDVAGTAPLRMAAGGAYGIARQPSVNPSILRLDAVYASAKAPRNLGARMILVADPSDPESIVDQYLYVWFNGHPAAMRLTLRIDDGPAVEMAGAWQNPGDRSPALVKVDEASIPGTGLSHRLTIGAQALVDGAPSGPVATVAIYAKTPNPRPNIPVEWISAALLRQTTDAAVDLTEVRWRHPGAVRIVARIPVRSNFKWITRIVAIAYADHHEDQLLVENLGSLLEYLGPTLREVTIGASAISRNRFGPIAWAASPLFIRAWNPHAVVPPSNPDQAAGTAEQVIDSWYKWHTRLATLRVHPPETPQKNSLINTALARLFLKIKDIVRKGGSVQIDDFGRFEARWNATNTVRSPAFVPSPGFREGTRTGQIMTDDRA